MTLYRTLARQERVLPAVEHGGETRRAGASVFPNRNEADPLRVLALVYHFAPSGNSASIRNTKILRRLPESSVRLDLVTIDGSYVSSNLNPDLLGEVPANLNVVRTRCVYPQEALIRLRNRLGRSSGVQQEQPVGTIGEPRPSRKSAWQSFKDLISYALMIPDKCVGWYPFALWAAYRQIRRSKCEIIYAVGQPWTAFLVGYSLKLLSGKPLVIDFMDPWASRARSWEQDRPEALSRIAAALERFIVARADFVVANTDELAADFRARLGLSPDGMRVITCGFDPADFRNLPPKHEGKALVITHAGSCYGLRSPVNIIRAVKHLIDSHRIAAESIRLNFIGHVPVADPQLAGLLGDPQIKQVVHIEPWLPHAAALECLSQSDVLLLLQPGLQLAVPAKLYEYAAVGRPILALAELDGGVAREVRDKGLGVTVQNEDVDGIAREIERFARQFRDNELKAEYTPADIAEYSVESLAAKLSDILHDVSRRRARARVA
jgi:glycosyltransferase involved in cell wall biosynthesis